MSEERVVVLVVDDEEIDLSLVRRCLESAGGFSVLTETTAEGAKRAFVERGAEIDLLVVDVSLPGGSGVDLAKSFLRERPGLKALFMSGWVGAELLRQHGIEESDRHFLSKPFRPADLIERARSVVGGPPGIEWLAQDAGEASSGG
jgi:two-component system, cell cycle sensor histidine kinase and response regulator CckA